jgi:hypothetical protein
LGDPVGKHVLGLAPAADPGGQRDGGIEVRAGNVPGGKTMTMTMSTAPMASGGITPGVFGMTVQPMVRTRKKVPMNSAIYLRITGVT